MRQDFRLRRNNILICGYNWGATRSCGLEIIAACCCHSFGCTCNSFGGLHLNKAVVCKRTFEVNPKHHSGYTNCKNECSKTSEKKHQLLVLISATAV